MQSVNFLFISYVAIWPINLELFIIKNTDLGLINNIKHITQTPGLIWQTYPEPRVWSFVIPAYKYCWILATPRTAPVDCLIQYVNKCSQDCCLDFITNVVIFVLRHTENALMIGTNPKVAIVFFISMNVFPTAPLHHCTYCSYNY